MRRPPTPPRSRHWRVASPKERAKQFMDHTRCEGAAARDRHWLISSEAAVYQHHSGKVQTWSCSLDDVGSDARGSCGHRPSHVAVAHVENAIAISSTAAEDRRALRRHWPETRPILWRGVVSAVREDVANHRQHMLEILRTMRLVETGEFRRRGGTQPVAKTSIGNKVVFIDAAHGWRVVAAIDRQSD